MSPTYLWWSCVNIRCAYHSLWWIPEGSVLWLTSMVNGEWWIQVVSVAWWVSAYTSHRSSWPGECYTGIGEEAVNVIVTVLDFTRFNCSPASTKLEIKRLMADSANTVTFHIMSHVMLHVILHATSHHMSCNVTCYVKYHITCHIICHVTQHISCQHISHHM